MFAEARDARICFDSFGDGEPVVMIGGFGAGRGYWSKAPACLPGYRIICLDNRGVGDTEYEGRFSVSDMADDVVAVLDSAGIGRAHIVGWSMGSHIARNLASRHPDRVEDLTLVGTYLDRPARQDFAVSGVFSAVVPQTKDGNNALRAGFAHSARLPSGSASSSSAQSTDSAFLMGRPSIA